MLRLHTALVVALALATGCHFYIDDDDEEIVDPPFEDDWSECDRDSDCPPGCLCESGQCIETEWEEWCADDIDCPDGWSCLDGVCGINEPECWDSQQCALGEVCDQDVLECRPAIECAEHLTLAACEADMTNSCEPVSRGINCTHPDGGDCQTDPASCTCEAYEFASCVASDPAP